MELQLYGMLSSTKEETAHLNKLQMHANKSVVHVKEEPDLKTQRGQDHVIISKPTKNTSAVHIKEEPDMKTERGPYPVKIVNSSNEVPNSFGAPCKPISHRKQTAKRSNPFSIALSDSLKDLKKINNDPGSKGKHTDYINVQATLTNIIAQLNAAKNKHLVSEPITSNCDKPNGNNIPVCKMPPSVRPSRNFGNGQLEQTGWAQCRSAHFPKPVNKQRMPSESDTLETMMKDQTMSVCTTGNDNPSDDHLKNKHDSEKRPVAMNKKESAWLLASDLDSEDPYRKRVARQKDQQVLGERSNSGETLNSTTIDSEVEQIYSSLWKNIKIKESPKINACSVVLSMPEEWPNSSTLPVKKTKGANRKRLFSEGGH